MLLRKPHSKKDKSDVSVDLVSIPTCYLRSPGSKASRYSLSLFKLLRPHPGLDFAENLFESAELILVKK
jgi:hypothetical protein